MSQRLSGSGGSEFDNQEEVEEENFQIYGMFFCGTCKSIMTPNK